MESKNSPTVSVIMPVYNAGGFLVPAIESILNQTFKNFEFIILNDGSTDSSTEIIDRYARKDGRIKICGSRNENKGYATRLNEGIELAAGKYIARMDADDISVKDRLQKQVRYLDKNSQCAVLATRIQPINENGSIIDEWEADKLAVEPGEISALMTKENCIAHPSIMARAEIMRRFMYDTAQSPSEDYDLWLRILSSKFHIHKLNKKLVLYRIHSASVSQTSIRQTSVLKKYLIVKTHFLIKQLKKPHLGRIEVRVAYSLFGIIVQMSWRKVKKSIKRFGLKRPFNLVKLNRITRRALSGRRILLITPWMTAGGADKVFLDLATHLHDSGHMVFCMATVPSRNEWRKLFEKVCSEVIIADQKYDADKIPQFIVDYSARNKIDTVVTSNNAAGYLAAAGLKMSNPRIEIIDIIHGQGGKFEKGGWPFHSAPFDNYLDKRVVVTQYIKKHLVEEYNISAAKIKVIHNGIKINKLKPPKSGKEFEGLDDKFIILWSGRFSEEKHPELAIETAKLVLKETDDVRFILVGAGETKDRMIDIVSKDRLGGKVIIAARPYKDYREYMPYADVLLMTSEMEGLPIVILEAFASGLPVLAPKVGGIPEIVTDKVNGFLFDFSETLPRRAAEKILYLNSGRNLAKQMGGKGLQKLEREFTYEKMMYEYDEVIL